MSANDLNHQTKLMMNFYRGYKHGKPPTDNRLDRDRR